MEAQQRDLKPDLSAQLGTVRSIKARGSAKERSMTVSVVQAICSVGEARKQNSHRDTERALDCGFPIADFYRRD